MFNNLSSIDNEIPFPIIEVDPDGNVLYMNPATTKYLDKYGMEEKEISKILPKGFVEAVRLCHSNNSPLDTVSLEIGGDIMVWQLYPNPKGLNIRAYAMDVTDQIRAEREALYMARHDILTGLPNRVMFFDRVSQSLESAKRYKHKFALLFLDLDRFKSVNDTHGHNIGDMLLKETAERLITCVRGSDTVARMGGDEFTIILSHIAEEIDAARVAEKIIASVKTPFHLAGKQCDISISIGISVYPSDADNTETLLINADSAMYCAKKDARNEYHFYTSDMNVNARKRLIMENDLRKAIERQELILHYQPQMDIDGKIIGMEALVRWNNPDRGIVPPDDFIPLAEEIQFITPLGNWVLHTACRQNKAWQDAGFKPLRVAVNISCKQLDQQDFIETVAEILKETGLDPEYLELELTESAIIQNIKTVVTMLHKLKEMGIHLSIDDFGTGYSSLTNLRRLPIDKLKIDKSFVQDITTDPDDAVIVTTIIAMAKSLKLRVVAEGVETKKQLYFLHEQGCREIQGFYFSKPLSVGAFTNLLKIDD